jgi:hypothetical protein
MHARLGTFEVAPGRLDDATAFFEQEVVARFEQHAGFRGYTAYVDRERGRLVGILFWETRDALVASAATALQARTDAVRVGAVTVGEPELLELAFDVRR